MKAIRIVAVALAMAPLSACGFFSDAEENQTEERPAPNYKVISSISDDPDPEKRQAENEAMVDSMYEDDMIPAELIPGEAYRRGVEVDQERLNAKIAREKARGGPAQEPNSPQADSIQSE